MEVATRNENVFLFAVATSTLRVPSCFMPSRFAASLGILAFALCLVIGCVQADNTFMTTIGRALLAMGGTLVVGFIVGHAGQRMIDERVGQMKASSEKNAQAENAANGR